jgi:hypothetical protein
MRFQVRQLLPITLLSPSCLFTRITEYVMRVEGGDGFSSAVLSRRD